MSRPTTPVAHRSPGWEHPGLRTLHTSNISIPGGKRSHLYFSLGLFVLTVLLVNRLHSFPVQDHESVLWSALCFFLLGLFYWWKYITVPPLEKPLRERLEPYVARDLQTELATASFTPSSPSLYSPKRDVPSVYDTKSPLQSTRPVPMYSPSLSDYSSYPSSPEKFAFSSPLRSPGSTNIIGSSPKLANIPIKSPENLSAYLNAYHEEVQRSQPPVRKGLSSPDRDSSMKPDGAWSPVSPYSQSFTIAQYHTAPAPEMPREKKEKTFEKEIPWNELYETLRITGSIDSWTESMRLWFSHMILKPLVEAMDAFENLYQVELKNCRSRRTSAALAAAAQQPTLPHMWHTTVQNQPEDPNKSAQMMGHLEKIDVYLEVSGTSFSREYVITRIRAEGSYLTNYTWNNTTGDTVTDSQILIHLFCTFMDEQLEIMSSYTNKLFTSRHFVMTPSKPEHLNTDVVIYQTHLKPPQFDIVVKGEKWEIKPGRHNLFQCLAVFVYYFMTKQNGFIHGTDLRGMKIQLARVVE